MLLQYLRAQVHLVQFQGFKLELILLAYLYFEN